MTEAVPPRTDGNITDREIIQLDATVIAGLIILFTITTVTLPSSLPEQTKIIFSKPAVSLYAVLSIIPFSISAIFLMGWKEVSFVGRYAAAVGLGILVAAAVVTAVNILPNLG